MSKDWSEVTRRSPCPVCSKPDWCGTSDKFVRCMRSTDTPSGYKRVKEYPDGGWLFVLDDGTSNGNGHAKTNGRPKTPRVYPTADDAVTSFLSWPDHQGGTLSRTPYSDSFESLRLDYPDERGKDIMPLSRRGDGAWWFKRPTGVLPLCPAYWRDDTTVIVTEGEKDMHALGALGQCVTTSAFGSKAATKSDWSPLADRDVIVWPDNDEPGERYLADVARLVGHPIRVFRPSGAGDAHGATDWIARQTDEGLADVEAIIDATAEPYHVSDVVEPEAEQQDQPGTFHRTDTGNAERFVSQHGRDLHFRSSRTGNYEGGAWFVWQGTHWALDETLMVPGLVKATVREMYAEAATIEDPEKRQALVNYAKGCESKHRRAAMLSLAKSESGIAIKPTAFDTDVWQFNCTNGTLDLRTGKMRSHNRADLITRMAPVAYDPDAVCSRWDRFLMEIMDANTDLIGFLQRLFGYCLTGDIREQILPIFYGAGANGKSVFIDTIKGLMGGYASDAPPGLLMVSQHDEHPTEIAGLQGQRLIVSSETQEGRQLKVQLVKRLTGDSTLKGRYMREDFFEFERTFKTLLVTNNRPAIREDKLAVWRRIKLIPFEVVIPPEEQDRELLPKLRTEWPGILRWAVEGCQGWLADGLTIPDAVNSATDAYRTEQDELAPFFDERLEDHPVAKVSRKELFATYTKWAQDNNEKYPLKRADLYERMKQRDYEPGSWRDGKSVVRGFVGVGLRISQG